jgi:hypothetical protein
MFGIKLKISFLALLGAALPALAQESLTETFGAPFDFPTTLAGNFGELRNNHFHGGVDFKTQGVTGKPIHSIADGYISRVQVTPGGYGQAVYVTHPNGYTSVYGHVEAFTEAVAKAVQTYQQEHETFSVDLTFQPDQFPCRKGDIIALSGNEGYSMGPHLHMEIRHTENDELVDPLPFYKHLIKDTTAPRAVQVVLYPQRNKGVVAGSAHDKAIPVSQLATPIEAWGEVGAGITANDYMDGTSNNYGVRSIVLYVDSAEVYRSTVDQVLFSENRMINAWTDYVRHRTRNIWVMRSFRLPGCPLRLVHTDANRGIVNINEERDYHFRYELTDLYGNRSTVRFTLRGRCRSIPVDNTPTSHYLSWDKTNVVQEPGLQLAIPRGMLYDDVPLHLKMRGDSTRLSFEYQLHDELVPLQSGCELMIRLCHPPKLDPQKYYIQKKGYGSVGGEYAGDGWIRAKVNELATYSVAVDTVPPRLVPLDKTGWARGNIRFRIGDAETGIRDYRVEIDGRYEVFAYSSLHATLRMKYPERLKRGVRHRMVVTLTDNCGNVKKEEFSF